jgi:acyl-coenzyme A thioesterase PaaI-like protein
MGGKGMAKDKQKTHLSVSAGFVGTVEYLEDGKSAEVTLSVGPLMKTDDRGLIHGGFTFGLADYAAMAAVNDPFVVLIAAHVYFRKPVVVGDRLRARAHVLESEGPEKTVSCEVLNQEGVKVFEGEFVCRVLHRHVLDS